MFATRLRRLAFTLTLSLAVFGGTVFLSHGESPSQVAPSFIRCENPPGTCDDQCDGPLNMYCGLSAGDVTATCCAMQYYSGGQCEDEHEDTFVCYGYKSSGGGGGDDLPRPQ